MWPDWGDPPHSIQIQIISDPQMWNSPEVDVLCVAFQILKEQSVSMVLDFGQFWSGQFQSFDEFVWTVCASTCWLVVQRLFNLGHLQSRLYFLVKTNRLRDVVVSHVFQNLFPHYRTHATRYFTPDTFCTKHLLHQPPFEPLCGFSGKASVDSEACFADVQNVIQTWNWRVPNEFFTSSILGWKLMKGRCIQQAKRHSSAVRWPLWPTPLVQPIGESEERGVQSVNLKCWCGRQHELLADLQIITRSFSHTHALAFSSAVASLWTFAAFCSAKHRVLSSLPPLLRLWRTSSSERSVVPCVILADFKA